MVIHLTAQQPQHEHHEKVHAFRAAERGVRWPDERDDDALGPQNLEGFLWRFARDGAQNGIVVPQHILKFLLLVIDHLIGSQAPHQLHVASAGRCRHLGSEVFRELDRERANASSACGDEHLVAGLDVCTLLERLARRQSDHRDREAACTKSRCAGLSAAAFSGTIASSARAPVRSPKMLAKTASPGLKRVTRLPTSITTPAKSLPSVAGS